MEKLLALLTKGQFDSADDQGEEEIQLSFVVPDDEGGVHSFTVTVELDTLKDLGLKHPNGDPVDFSSIYEDYDRDDDGNEKDEEADEEAEEKIVD